MQREQKRSFGDSLKKIGDFFPLHFIMEILSRLPVKTLLQFQVVCKSWYAIIKNPYFIFKHLKNHYISNDDCGGCLIVQYTATQAGELTVREFLVDDKIKKFLACEILETPIYNTYICGPCDGIFYLWRYYSNERFLWNPAINELKILPPIIPNPNLPSHINFYGKDFYGFGYDSSTEDSKVIVIKRYKDTSKDPYHAECVDFPLLIFIYSLRNDSWRYWGDLPKFYYLSHNTCYVFVDNSVYWLASLDSDSIFEFDVIISFNLVSGNFEELQLPNYEESVEETLGLCQNSLSLIFGYKEKKCFVMWSFNEGCWTKKCTLNIDFKHNCRPLGHWKDNKLLFWADLKLILYDIETHETWYVHSTLGECPVNISVYKESLVRIIDQKMWTR